MPRASRLDPDGRRPLVKANDRFVARMNKAIKSGRETAEAGTFVDLTPSKARATQRPMQMSGCGSPGAACLGD
jgi:hypothetical protein